MKKIYLALIAIMISAFIPVGALAVSPKVTVSNDNGEIKIDITSGMRSKSVDMLIENITDCKEPHTSDIKVVADEDANVSLRLLASELPEVGTNPLNNYIITIKDENENLVYESEGSPMVDTRTSYKDMPLGRLSKGITKTYTVSYELIDDELDTSKVSVEVAAETATLTPTAVPTVAPTVKPTATLKPKFDFDSLEESGGFIFDFDEEFKNETSTDTSKAQKEIKKVCGKDIPEGRFSVTGNGKLAITSANGNVKASYVVSSDGSIPKSVKTAVVLLEKGDVLTINPNDGDEKARLKFDKVSTAATTTTATPVNAENDKTNPKTSDSSTVAVLSVAILAVLAFAGLEILKRKKNN